MTLPADPTIGLARQIELGQSLPADVACAVLVSLSDQVATLHAAGRIHRTLIPAAIEIEEDGSVLLKPPAPICWLGKSPIVGTWLPPELRNVAPFEMPSNMAAASASLQHANVTLPLQQIDIYQLGSLLCQFLTGEMSEAYLRSLQVKQRVPESIRPILERALGCDGKNRFESAEQLSAKLRELSLSNPMDQPSFLPPKLASRSDTTPSALLPRNQIADTTVGANSPINKPSPTESIPFQQLGHYEILSRIGQGGMGDVYLGYERSLDRKVAIKVLPVEFARQPDFVRRFRAEATAAAKLVHPNVIQIYYIGETDGFHFFSMQYIEGESLADLLKKQRRLSVDACLEIVEQIFAGLAVAHKQGLVHRDIKPGNVLLDQQHHRALLADFGLVKSLQSPSDGKTVTGVILGTVDYMPPEQARGKEVDHRADLYSMGVLMYQMISGRLPFEADTPTALIFQHVYEQPPPLGESTLELPQSIIDVVEKLLRKSPDERYQSADEVLADLRLVRAGKPIAKTDPKQAVAAAVAIETRESPAEEKHLPFLDADLSEDADKGWWDRAVSLVRRRSPVALQHLQNTQQQIGGAIAEYERRRRKLTQLVSEAQAVLVDLRAQAESHRNESDRNPAAANIADELDRQVADHVEQLEKIYLELAQVKATHQKLITQRDLLNARLAAAQAGMHLASGRRQQMLFGNQWVRRTVAVACVIFLVGMMYRAIFFSSYGSSSNQRVATVGAVPDVVETPTNSIQTRSASTNPVYQNRVYTKSVQSIKPNPTVPGPKPTPVIPAATSSQDLLQHIDLARDLMQRSFQKEGTSYVGVSHSRLYLPANVPDDYRLNYTIRRLAGEDALALGFVMSGRSGMVALDCHYSRFSGLYVDGQEPLPNDPLFKAAVPRKRLSNVDAELNLPNRQLLNGTSRVGSLFKYDLPAEVAITVHPNHLTVTFNEEILVDWYGDANRLYLHSDHGMPSRECPFVVTSDATYQFDKAILTPIAPETEPVRKKQLDKQVDVMPLLDPRRDAVSGMWQVSGTTLSTPETQINRISIPVDVPEEYTISAVIETPTTAHDELCLTFGLVVGQSMVQAMYVNGNRLALDTIDGKRWTDNETTVLGHRLQPGIPELFECTVTKQGIRLQIGGRTMIDWRGDFRRLGIPADWAVPDGHRLFLGASGHYLLRDIKIGPPSPDPILPNHRQFAIGNPVELLSMIDAARDALLGSWTNDSKSLRVLGNKEDTFLVLPTDVPEEYQFTAVLEREPGEGRSDDGLLLKLPVGRYMADVGIDFYRSSVSGIYLDGLLIDGNETYTKTRVIPPSGPQEIICTVRKTGVKIATPDRTILDWVGNPERLAGDIQHSTPSSKIALGSRNTGFRFDRLAIEPLAPAKISPVSKPDRDGKLLSVVQPERDSRKGLWKLDQQGLTNPLVQGARLRIPVALPERYVFTANVERRQGMNQLCIGLVVGGHPCNVVLDIDGKHAGLERIDDKPVGDKLNLTRRDYQEPLLPIGKTVKIQSFVLRDTVIVLCDNKEVIRWHGDPRRFSSEVAYLPPNYSELDRSHLWLGTSNSEFFFHDLRLNELRSEQADRIAANFDGVFPIKAQFSVPLIESKGLLDK